VNAGCAADFAATSTALVIAARSNKTQQRFSVLLAPVTGRGQNANQWPVI
jgi:hypothetical protein